MSEFVRAQRERSAVPVVRPGAVADLAGTALGVWMGQQALRAYFAAVVWNVGENMPAARMGLIALAVFAVGLLGSPAARLAGGPRPTARFSLMLGGLLAANQALAHPVADAVLAFAAAICWMWWLPAQIVSLGRRGAAETLVPGLLLGLAADVALRTALHGLDLFFMRGIWPLAGALAMAALLAWAAGAGSEAVRGAGGSTARLPGPGLYALGPFLVLQMTLLANPGRIAVLTGWDPVPAAGLALLGLVAALAAVAGLPAVAGRPGAGSSLVGALRIGLAAAAVAVLTQPVWLHGSGAWLLVAVQAGMGLALAGGLFPSPRPGGVHAWWASGGLLFFALIFYYYSRYEWPTLWLVAGMLAVLPGLWPRAAAAPGARPALAAALVIGLAGLGIGVAGRDGATPRRGPAPADLTVLNYNIHQGFDYRSVPGIQQTAAFIADRDADLVALQEVGRGWTINGGVDLVAYLQWRLPQYHVIYGPMNGNLWGNVILSRYPVQDSGAVRFPVRHNDFQRGLTWVTVQTVAGDLTFASAHLTAYSGADNDRDREAQAGDIAAFWSDRPRTVIAGDFNAPPDALSIDMVLASGLVDLPADWGLGDSATYSATAPVERIDYVFASPDVAPVSAVIPASTASDHLPVEVKISLP